MFIISSFDWRPAKWSPTGTSGRSRAALLRGNLTACLERITTIEPADNSWLEGAHHQADQTQAGASPLLFSEFLMSLAAFVSLEDISSELPPYTEQVIGGTDGRAPPGCLQKAGGGHQGRDPATPHEPLVVSVGLNALLLYPDHPWNIGDLYGYDYAPETQRRERLLIAQPEDLDQEFVYAKERRLIEIVKAELQNGPSLCHVYAVYTRKRDVTRRLESILAREGIHVAVLTSDVPPEKREGWFAQRLREGVQVTISHPKIIETGMDLLSHPA